MGDYYDVIVDAQGNLFIEYQNAETDLKTECVRITKQEAEMHRDLCRFNKQQEEAFLKAVLTGKKANPNKEE